MTAAKSANSATVVGGTFENMFILDYTTMPLLANEAFNLGSGIQQNGSSLGYAATPEGTQTGWIASTFLVTGAISLGLADLVVGQDYTISFLDASRAGYTSNSFTVSYNGAQIGSYTTASTAWSGVTTNSFTATGTTGTLTFAGTPVSGLFARSDVGIDGVSISAAVPEPASWAMMVAGFGLLGGMMRRRRPVPAFRVA